MITQDEVEQMKQEIEEENNRCEKCGTKYSLKKGKPEICWVCKEKTNEIKQEKK